MHQINAINSVSYYSRENSSYWLILIHLPLVQQKMRGHKIALVYLTSMHYSATPVKCEDRLIVSYYCGLFRKSCSFYSQLTTKRTEWSNSIHGQVSKVKVRRPQIQNRHVVCNTFNMSGFIKCKWGLFCYPEITPDIIINIIPCSILQAAPDRARTHKVTCIKPYSTHTQLPSSNDWPNVDGNRNNNAHEYV